MNEKIAKQLAHMDQLVFDLRMSLSALQSELHPSATYSTKVPVDQYNNTMFEASPQSRESPDEVNVKVSQTEPRYTGEAALTDYDDPDGFHGKSYKDYQKSCLADTVHHKDYKKELVLPE
jgi:hypothetical protein